MPGLHLSDFRTEFPHASHEQASIAEFLSRHIDDERNLTAEEFVMHAVRISRKMRESVSGISDQFALEQKIASVAETIFGYQAHGIIQQVIQQMQN